MDFVRRLDPIAVAQLQMAGLAGERDLIGASLDGVGTAAGVGGQQSPCGEFKAIEYKGLLHALGADIAVVVVVPVVSVGVCGGGCRARERETERERE